MLLQLPPRRRVRLILADKEKDEEAESVDDGLPNRIASQEQEKLQLRQGSRYQMTKLNVHVLYNDKLIPLKYH